MGVRSKTITTVALVLVVVGVLIMQTENRGLFKGQVTNGPDTAEVVVQEVDEDTLMPDIVAGIVIVEGEVLTVDATIENIGPGSIEGGQSFVYKLELNGKEVLSNSDSYSALEVGDSFTFNFPISEDVYSYPENGTIKFTVDTQETIDEVNEENNSIEIPYNL